jgi:hypothetical protein
MLSPVGTSVNRRGVCVDHFYEVTTSYPNKCCTGTPLAPATRFAVGDTHTMLNGLHIPRKLPNLPEGVDELQKVSMYATLCINISRKHFFIVDVFISLNIDGKSVLNLLAVEYC